MGLTVTDDSVLEMIEKREQAPRLPVMVLLEPEVKELADAQIYLDEKNPRPPLAVDLLLGTQGWRRFAFMDAEKFIARKRRRRPPRPGAAQSRRGMRWQGCGAVATALRWRNGVMDVGAAAGDCLQSAAAEPRAGAFGPRDGTRRM